MRKNLALVILISATAVTACGGSSGTETTTQAPVETVAETTAEAPAIEETTEAETEPATVNDYEWDAGELAYLGLDRDEIWEIYDEFMGMIEDEYLLEDGNAMEAFENECMETIAEEHGITPDDVDQIIFASVPTYYATFDPDDVEIEYGELQNIKINGKTIMLVVKIEPSFTKNMTIEQNYFNVCYFVRKYLGDYDYDEIQYWANADMTSGNEGRAISFTVPKNIIKNIQSGTLIDNQLGNYVDDLWILPSLTQ